MSLSRFDRLPRRPASHSRRRVAGAMSFGPLARAVGILAVGRTESRYVGKPTSAPVLDFVGEVRAALKQVPAGGRTMRVATHELARARAVCDQIVVVETGRVVEVGTPVQAFNHPQSARTRERVRRSASSLTIQQAIA